MAGLKPEDPIGTDGDKADVEVPVWDDPVWTPALHSLTEDADPTPIAVLLREGEAPPFEVLERLGIMLDPPDGYIGHSLTVKRSKKNWRKAATKMGEERQIRERILLFVSKGMKKEAAIAQVMQETGLSRAKIFEILQLDNEEVVRRAETMFGRSTPKSPRKRP